MDPKQGDVVQVGIPEGTNRQLVTIMDESGYFKEQIDVYKTAVAVAISRNMESDKWKNRSSERLVNKFATSTLDPDGKLKQLIALFVPDVANCPYRYSQWLATAGIGYLHKELVENGNTLIDALHLDDDETNDSAERE
jgi:hypothetical protein